MTWLLSTSSWVYSCRLSVEIDQYSCWFLIAFPLAAGISITALGGVVIFRGISNLSWPLKVRRFTSWKAMLVFGTLLLFTLWIITLQFILRIASRNLGIGTLFSVIGVATLVLLTFEWIQSYLNPNRMFLADRKEIDEDVN